jgi:Zn-dependent protease
MLSPPVYTYVQEKKKEGLPPNFLWSLVALANLMRLSLQKAAHAIMSGAAYRKFGSPILFNPGTLGRTWGTRPGGWAGEEARDLSPNLRMILAQPASPATKAGCPIQARFWLEWDTTALDVLFFVIRKTKWEPRIHAAATWNK